MKEAFLRPLQNAPFCPISASGTNFKTRNTQCIPAVKFFAFLELEQIRDNFYFYTQYRRKKQGKIEEDKQEIKPVGSASQSLSVLFLWSEILGSVPLQLR